MKKNYALLFVFVMGVFSLSNAQVVINEFSAANKSSYADAGGAYNDWLEIYNPTGAAVNIGGWYLSDSPGNLTKWQIPAGVTVNANGFKIFFCSNRGGVFSGQQHTNFKLTQSDTSEVLLLTNASGVIVDSTTVYPTRVNHSRGRATNGSGAWSVFQTPTPNASNNTQTAYPSYVPKVQFSLPAGFYSGTQSVSLTCSMANTSIRYTTNGAVPTTASTLFAGPISVSANTVIRARAFDNSSVYAGSFDETNSYFINETHTLPVMSLTSDQFNNLFNGNVNFTAGSMEYFGTNNAQIFEIESEYSPHGNDSWAYPQKGMDFNIEDEYGTGHEINYKVFTTTPRHHYDWLILKAAASDNFPGNLPNPAAHIRDAYVQTLAEKFNLNVDFRRMEHCLVFINGQYWGVYEIRDRVDADYFNYYYNQPEQYVDDLKYWGGMNVQYGSDTAWTNLYNFVITHNLAIPANYTFVTDRLNVMSMIDAVALGLYTVDSDWLNWNTAWWRGRRTPNIVKWKYWLWDEDNTFNLGENFTGWANTDFTANPCDVNTANGGGPDFSDPGIGAEMGHIVIFNALMQNPDFEQLYINRFADLLNSAFNCTNMTNHLDTMIARIQPEMQRQCTRWGGSYNQWLQNVQYLRGQITGRCSVIGAAMDTCYHVTGPYPLVVNVYPVNSGTVLVNTINPPAYPWHSTYFGGVNLVCKASANPGYQFSHWTIQGHTLNPSMVTDSIWFDLVNSGDSLTAVFIPTDSVRLTVVTNPNPGGNISVNGVTPPSYPYTFTFADSTILNIVETPNAGYNFVNWSILHHTLLPNNSAANIGFMILVDDTLTANYQSDSSNLVVLANIAQAGTVTVNGTVISTYPKVMQHLNGSTVNILATANAGYSFVRWTLIHHTVSPNDSSIAASFVIQQQDTLLATFKTDTVANYNVVVQAFPPVGGSITVNGTTYTTYPSVLNVTTGTLLNVSATPNAGYAFFNWHIVHAAPLPNDTANPITCTITQSDTIYAFFVPLPPDTFKLTVLANIPTGGSATVNGTVISVYPSQVQYQTGTLVNISAAPNGGYNFVNWTLLHHVLSPSSSSNNASFTITQNDTLTVNFALIPDSSTLVVVANIPAAGNVNVNGTLISSYPTSLQDASGTLLNISALPNVGYSFVNWSLLHHTVSPSMSSTTGSFTVTQDDTLVANFKTDTVAYNVVLQAFPPVGGNIVVNGTTYPNPNPTTIAVNDGSVLNVSAVAAAGYQFFNWHIVYANPLPTDTSNPMSCTITQTDTIYAFFTPLPTPDSFDIVVQALPNAGGDITVNGTVYASPNYPYTIRVETGTVLSVTETPKPTWHFVNWELLHHTVLPTDTSHPMNFTVTQNDTLTAHYIQDSTTILVNVHPYSFSGDVTVAGFTPPTYPWLIKVPQGTMLDFAATGNQFVATSHTYNYVFDHYAFKHHSPLPDSLTAIVFINVQRNDTVDAYFIDVPITTDSSLYLLIPSGFSPDGNGVNDVFHVIGEQLTDYYMQVYNRWGQRVFESHNQGYGWDGLFNNNKCDIGVYAYTLHAKRISGEEVDKKGTITLVR